MGSEKQRHAEVGRVGENTACRFLEKEGFRVIERNYRKKWGEIDIIAKRSGVLHFIEVKTVSRENVRSAVTRESDDRYRPEDNVHPWKLQRLSRTIQAYLLEHELANDWSFDIICVFLNLKDKEARVEMIKDIVL